jgi:hypothetical protein
MLQRSPFVETKNRFKFLKLRPIFGDNWHDWKVNPECRTTSTQKRQLDLYRKRLHQNLGQRCRPET